MAGTLALRTQFANVRDEGSAVALLGHQPELVQSQERLPVLLRFWP
jgi:hypothetical protein